MPRWSWHPLLLLSFACTDGTDAPVTDEPDTDTDADADTDTDTDTDADADTDQETDTDTGLPCVDDPNEPNEDQGSAIPLANAVGLVVSDSSDDWFSFQVPAAQMAIIDVTFFDALGDLDLRAYDETGNIADSSTSFDDNEQVIVFNETGVTATFVARVNHVGGGCNTYDYNVTIQPIPPEICDDQVDNDFDAAADCFDIDCLTDPACTTVCPEDAHEPNDSPSAAVPLTSGADLLCHVNSHDWFSFVVPDGSAATVSLDFSTTDGDLDLEIQDLAGAFVAGSYSLSDNEEASFLNFSGNSTTYRAGVLLNGSSDPCNTYDYEVNIESPPACVDDDTGTNDTLASALDTEMGSYVATAASEDWYRFDAEPSAIVTVNAEFEPKWGDLDLTVVDSTGTAVATTFTLGGTAEASFTNTSTTTETFWSNVSLSQGYCNSYDYVVTKVIPPPCNDDDSGTNDTLGTAADLASVAAPAVTSTSPDWYSFEVPDQTIAQLSLEFTHVFGDVDVSVFDANGVAIAGSASVSDDEVVSFLNQSGGPATYYAEVSLFSGSCNAYTTQLNTAPIPTCGEDANEPNDSFAAALPSTGGSGLAVLDTSPDWWTFSLEADEDAVIEAEFFNVLGDIDVEVYDSAQNFIDGSYSVSDNELVTVSNTSGQAQDYVVEIDLFSGACNLYDYSLTVQ